MALADDIRNLRDRTIADFNSAHDYYAQSGIAWRLVRKVIEDGQKFALHSKVTGTSTTQDELAARAVEYVARELPEATFQQFLSIFENFFFDLLALWLTAFPRGMGAKKVDFQAVIDAPDKRAIIELMVRKELNEVLYDRPSGWFAYLEEKVKLGCPSVEEVGRIAEAKASRDVLVHNRGVANRSYESKAGTLARFRDGDRVLIPEAYHRATWELLRKVVSEVSDAAIAKAA